MLLSSFVTALTCGASETSPKPNKATDIPGICALVLNGDLEAGIDAKLGSSGRIHPLATQAFSAAKAVDPAVESAKPVWDSVVVMDGDPVTHVIADGTSEFAELTIFVFTQKLTKNGTPVEILHGLAIKGMVRNRSDGRVRDVLDQIQVFERDLREMNLPKAAIARRYERHERFLKAIIDKAGLKKKPYADFALVQTGTDPVIIANLGTGHYTFEEISKSPSVALEALLFRQRGDDKAEILIPTGGARRR